MERDSKAVISLVKALINPAVHLLPKLNNLRIALLPFYKHSLSLLKDWSLFLCLLCRNPLLNKLLSLFFQLIAESNIVFSNKVVTFYSRRLRSLTIAHLQPCKHRFADMDTTVVHKVHPNHIVAVSLKKS